MEELEEDFQGTGKVRTMVSCDSDPTCRKVLNSIHSSMRPEHIQGSLEERVCPKALAKAQSERDRLMLLLDNQIQLAQGHTFMYNTKKQQNLVNFFGSSSRFSLCLDITLMSQSQISFT